MPCALLGWSLLQRWTRLAALRSAALGCAAAFCRSAFSHNLTFAPALRDSAYLRNPRDTTPTYAAHVRLPSTCTTALALHLHLPFFFLAMMSSSSTARSFPPHHPHGRLLSNGRQVVDPQSSQRTQTSCHGTSRYIAGVAIFDFDVRIESIT